MKSAAFAGFAAAAATVLLAFPGTEGYRVTAVPAPAEGSLSVSGLRCEYRVDPAGIDVPRPRLGWILTSPIPGARQSAYQVLVASSPQILAQGRGDLWNSGKVLSDQSVQVEYAGRPLISRQQCFWKVRAWDGANRPCPWSQPATWSMGLLQPGDWSTSWITDPALADPANRPRTPIRCYRSQLASNPDAVKWIALDLGSPRRIDSINLAPARPPGLSWDISTVQFPRRFRIEVASNPDFSPAQTVVNQTHQDFPQPRTNQCLFHFSPVTARYVKLTVTRLGVWDARDYGIFLGQFQVFTGKDNVASGAAVACSDSIETQQWSRRFLVASTTNVGYSNLPEAVAVNMPGASPSRVPLLRKEFTLPAGIRKATLYITARGFYEARINGQRVGNDLLAPGFTDYHKRLSYQAYDVTGLVRPGANAIGAMLGYGWYAGHMNLGGNEYIYGYFPQLLAQLEVDFAGGKRITICSDGTWRTALTGPVLWSDLLDGECIDYRKALPGWDRPGFDEHTWQLAWSQPRDDVALTWDRCPPVRVIEKIRPVSMKEVRPGVYVYDMGQEFTGWCRVRADGPAGTDIVLRHAEAVKPDGSLDTASLWGTAQRDEYILDGKGPRVLEPHFTYHGFRYVELSGLPGRPGPDTLLGINIRSDVAITGQFTCSNDLYNRIMSNSHWTQANLFFDVPAGCAARSERLAWTGDIRPCVQTALFNFDTASFFAKYLIDLRDDQTADGRFTDICPHAHLSGTDICVGSPGWADAGVSMPWDLYVNTADRQALADQYPAARRWVDFIDRANPSHLWLNQRGQDWGDWLSAGLATPKDIGSTAFFAHDADLVSRMATVLGRRQDAKHFHDLFEEIRQAFVRRYVSPDGVITQNPTASGSIKDVTDLVRSLVKDNRLAFVVSNDSLGGDPALGKPKLLHLVVKTGSTQAVVDTAEGQSVDLSGTTLQPLQIVTATYGAPNDGAQGSYALALKFGLLNESLRSRAMDHLVSIIQRDNDHPTTGFWSSVELLLALSSNGENSVAARMMNLRSMPSWGYMAEHGTTFWEAFNANTTGMSLNHWTHSAVGEWLWRNVAGLNADPEHPGFHVFSVRPRPCPEVTWCRATYASVRGPIHIDWQNDAGTFRLNLTVPVGSTAIVTLPGSSPSAVAISGLPAARVRGVSFLGAGADGATYSIASGTWAFNVR